MNDADIEKRIEEGTTVYEYDEYFLFIAAILNAGYNGWEIIGAAISDGAYQQVGFVKQEEECVLELMYDHMEHKGKYNE